MRDDAQTIALSLIAHTNVGKTTLARTLLGRDVGEVRDAQHITLEAASYVLVDTAEGDALRLWDTPGFGDSARLARRLQQQGNPVGWLLAQVWDRYRDRAFFLSQQVVRNVRDLADVVLYLVNASEAPGDAGYLAPELTVLDWIGKPVIVLINQTGPPQPREQAQVEEARWRTALGSRAVVHAVTTFDAFARCWVQEGVLFDLIGDALAATRKSAYGRLVAAWDARRVAQFNAAVDALTAPIAAAALDREVLPESGVGGMLRGLMRSLGVGNADTDKAKARAANAMATRLDQGLRTGMDKLLAIYGLDGRAKGDVLARLSAGVVVDAPVNEGKAAMMGGVASGAISGLAADIASGGLTFGAGMLAGAVLGALGGAGIARGMNIARATTGTSLRWDDAYLSGLVEAALLSYLAVAHYGRGRGDWVDTEYPSFWPPLVAELVATRRDRLALLWANRQASPDAERMQALVRPVLGDAAKEVLDRLYPSAHPFA
jgi:hypothetical protein